MPIWSEQPASVMLSNWNIVELDIDGTLTEHFIGYVDCDRYARISTIIQERDINNDGEIVGRTKSGSTYRLVGHAGLNSDGRYMYDVYFSKTEHKLLY